MKRELYRCVRCRYETSVTAGTIFQDTRKPLRLWFRAIWHLTSQKYGANALGLQRVLDLGCGEVGVQTGSGILKLVRVQVEGKKEMAIAEFVRGHRNFVGSMLPS